MQSDELEEAREVLLRLLIDEEVNVPPRLHKALMQIVMHPVYLVWDALHSSPQECLMAALKIDFEEKELTALIAHARHRLPLSVILGSVGSDTVIRDRLSQSLLWGQAQVIPRIRPKILQKLAETSGPLTASAALALKYMPSDSLGVVREAAISLAKMSPAAYEVMLTLAAEAEELSLETFLKHFELSSLVDGFDPPELLRLRKKLTMVQENSLE